MARNIITKAQLARMIGVTPAAISNAAAKKNSWLKSAVTKDGRINADHPVIVERLTLMRAGSDVTPTSALKPGPRRKAEFPAEAPTGKGGDPVDSTIPPHIRKFAEYPLIELVERFGSDIQFLDWLKSIEKIEVIEERRLKNAEREGVLVSRELVERGVIQPIDTVFTQILTDGAKSVATALLALSAAGAEAHEVEKKVHDLLASFISPAKRRIVKALR